MPNIPGDDVGNGRQGRPVCGGSAQTDVGAQADRLDSPRALGPYELPLQGGVLDPTRYDGLGEGTYFLV